MAAVTRKRGAKNYFIWGLSCEKLFFFFFFEWSVACFEKLSKLNISSQSKAQCSFRKRKTELKVIEKTKICTSAMLKPYSASSFCLPNKYRVGVAHGDGTNLEVVYKMPSKLPGCIGFLYKVVHIKLAVSLCSFSHFSFPFNFRTAYALVFKFGTLPLSGLFSNTLLAIFWYFILFKSYSPFCTEKWAKIDMRACFST